MQNQKELNRLVGFDTAGEVFSKNKRIFRGIYPGMGEKYKAVLRICEKNDLFRFGIVDTRLADDNPCPHLPYDLVLEHEQIPFISYPFEWATSMLKDAALLHIDLFLQLGRYELTIKDWHPYNILFKGSRPLFVDFTSIIPVTDLPREAYLNPLCVPSRYGLIWDTMAGYFYKMHQCMFMPYFLLPLYLMQRKHLQLARNRLLETTMNASCTSISENEVFSEHRSLRYEFWRQLKWIALAQPGLRKRLFFHLLQKEIECLSVSQVSSGYSDYYKVKGEEFEFEPSAAWTDKQKIVHKTLQRFAPCSVLDIGCNTGWFSVLAAKLGCNVVGMDVDEACVDLVYKRARQDGLPILALVNDITKLHGDVLPLEFPDEPKKSLIGGNFPLLISAQKRFQCDVTLVLALLHHLILGQGHTFEEIISLFSSLTKKCLICEFVASNDLLVSDNPSFFSAYNAHPQQFDWYTLNGFLEKLRPVFRNIVVQPSVPETRTLIICEN